MFHNPAYTWRRHLTKCQCYMGRGHLWSKRATGVDALEECEVATVPADLW